jgi:hypothetical protein
LVFLVVSFPLAFPPIKYILSLLLIRHLENIASHKIYKIPLNLPSVSILHYIRVCIELPSCWYLINM